MLTPLELDAYAAALATVGRFHREAPDQATLSAFAELIDQWPLDLSAEGETGRGLIKESFEREESPYRIKQDVNSLYGVSAKAKVAPYESVHRDRDGLVFDRSTLEVRAAYRRLGLRVPNLNREPDDHIGVELDFLARCLLNSLDAADEGNADEAQRYQDIAREFVAEHAGRWMPEMLARAGQAAETFFMKGICLLTADTLESLTRELN